MLCCRYWTSAPTHLLPAASRITLISKFHSAFAARISKHVLYLKVPPSKYYIKDQFKIIHNSSFKSKMHQISISTKSAKLLKKTHTELRNHNIHHAPDDN